MEAGELDSREPGGGKEAPACGFSEEKQPEHIVVPSAVPETSLNSGVSGRWASGFNCRPINPHVDEPDALIGQVRICGRDGG